MSTDYAAALASAARQALRPLPVRPMPWHLGMAGVAAGFGPRAVRPAMVVYTLRDLHGPDPTQTGDPQRKQATRSRSPPRLRPQRLLGEQMPPAEADSAEFARALAAWADLVTTIGRQHFAGLSSLRPVQSEFDGTLEQLHWVFAAKPPSTLQKRASSLRLYLQRAARSEVAAFPLSEPVVFEYLKAAAGVAPSRGHGFRGCLGFCGYYLGMDGVTAVLASKRCLGAQVHGLARKSLTECALPLSVREVQKLEECLFSTERRAFDRIASGFVLFCVHGRLRVHDALRICIEPKTDIGDEANRVGYRSWH